MGAFLEDIVEAHRGDDLEISIVLSPDTKGDPQPQVWRAPELLHGLGNIIENAADFAKSKVRVQARWNASQLRISVEDDGPGFAPDIFERIGEPYITSRPGHYALGETEIGPSGAFEKHEGMGLGFFIAKTLIEQTGGTVSVVNPASGGARVNIQWPRNTIDGEGPPGRGEG